MSPSSCRPGIECVWPARDTEPCPLCEPEATNCLARNPGLSTEAVRSFYRERRS